MVDVDVIVEVDVVDDDVVVVDVVEVGVSEDDDSSVLVISLGKRVLNISASGGVSAEVKLVVSAIGLLTSLYVEVTGSFKFNFDFAGNQN